jgi:hypothetical protein
MTPSEWFAETNPDRLLRIVHPQWFAGFGEAASRLTYSVDARLRWFGCAAARMVWDFLPTDAQSAVLVSERIASNPAVFFNLRAVAVRIVDGAGGFRQLAVNAAGWASAGVSDFQGSDYEALRYDPAEAGRCAARALATKAVGPAPPGHTRKTSVWHLAWTQLFNEARLTQAHFVRDLFPPPDHELRFDPAWLTSTVVALAKQIDDAGDYSIVPILADALQDAGCDDVTMLQCCRVPGNVHVRGNWVVDLVLGRD